MRNFTTKKSILSFLDFVKGEYIKLIFKIIIITIIIFFIFLYIIYIDTMKPLKHICKLIPHMLLKQKINVMKIF